MKVDLNKYHIDIRIDEYVFRCLIDNAADYAEEGDAETAKDYLEDLKFLKSIESGVDVSTLKEYFDLLDRISEAWGDGYHIYNDGRYIVIGED